MSTTISYIKNNVDCWYVPVFVILGTLLQVFCFCTHDDSLLSLVSGISGLIAVVLCARKRMSMYVFSFLQLFTYVALAYRQNLYGEIIENIFYFVMLVWGLFVWNRKYDRSAHEVESRKLSAIKNVILGVCVSAAIIVFWRILVMTDDTHPFLDALTTIPAFVGQILMTFRYREQWVYWFVIDVSSIIMWVSIGDYIMAVQFVFWTINCLYGFYKWTSKSV